MKTEFEAKFHPVNKDEIRKKLVAEIYAEVYGVSTDEVLRRISDSTFEKPPF